MVTYNGYIQSIERIKGHGSKFIGMCNGIPRGLSKADTLHALKAIKKSAEKAIEYFEQESPTQQSIKE